MFDPQVIDMDVVVDGNDAESSGVQAAGTRGEGAAASSSSPEEEVGRTLLALKQIGR